MGKVFLTLAFVVVAMPVFSAPRGLGLAINRSNRISVPQTNGVIMRVESAGSSECKQEVESKSVKAYGRVLSAMQSKLGREIFELNYVRSGDSVKYGIPCQREYTNFVYCIIRKDRGMYKDDIPYKSIITDSIREAFDEYYGELAKSAPKLIDENKSIWESIKEFEDQAEKDEENQVNDSVVIGKIQKSAMYDFDANYLMISNRILDLRSRLDLAKEGLNEKIARVLTSLESAEWLENDSLLWREFDPFFRRYPYKEITSYSGSTRSSRRLRNRLSNDNVPKEAGQVSQATTNMVPAFTRVNIVDNSTYAPKDVGSVKYKPTFTDWTMNSNSGLVLRVYGVCTGDIYQHELWPFDIEITRSGMIKSITLVPDAAVILQ